MIDGNAVVVEEEWLECYDEWALILLQQHTTIAVAHRCGEYYPLLRLPSQMKNLWTIMYGYYTDETSGRSMVFLYQMRVFGPTECKSIKIVTGVCGV